MMESTWEQADKLKAIVSIGVPELGGPFVERYGRLVPNPKVEKALALFGYSFDEVYSMMRVHDRNRAADALRDAVDAAGLSPFLGVRATVEYGVVATVLVDGLWSLCKHLGYTDEWEDVELTEIVTDLPMMLSKTIVRSAGGYDARMSSEAAIASIVEQLGDGEWKLAGALSDALAARGVTATVLLER